MTTTHNNQPDALTCLLRRDPTYGMGTDTPTTTADVLARFGDLGTTSLLSLLCSMIEQDNWAGSEEIARHVAKMTPNHSSREIGARVASNLRLIGLLAMAQAEVYRAYNADLPPTVT